jgi:CDP-paratose 2-epimerase
MPGMRSAVLVTGSGGLVGSETVEHFASAGRPVIGIDNDMRRYFFGAGASTRWKSDSLGTRFGSSYRHYDVDIRDAEALRPIFKEHARSLGAVIHAAAQPSHDWAAREPLTDFSINATGTLNMLELAREFCPDTPFVFTSTNKVYGDTPNRLPLEERPTRLELPVTHPWYDGIDESMSVDQSTHSVFGASKVAADVLVQEYGRYFNLPTACFRGGCLTGGGHSGAELHGFLSYVVRCALTGTPYTIYGYGGKQVRDNLHSHDLVGMFAAFIDAPRAGEVYNTGGGRATSVSVLEAIAMAREVTGREIQVTTVDENRVGDHRWWITSLRKFQSHYPSWRQRYDLQGTIQDIADQGRSRWVE